MTIHYYEVGQVMDQTVRAAIASAASSGDLAWAVQSAHDVLAAEGHYEGYFALVTTLLECGKPDVAVPYFAVLRDALPTQAEVAYGYGLALQRTGRLSEAIEQWKAALELAPEFADACRNVAMALIDQGLDDEASVFLQRLLTLRPNDPDALLHLGNIAFRGGATADAGAHYRAALRALPGSIEAWINLGEAERTAGRFAEAETCFRQVIALSPEARQAHFNLGALLLEQGRWGEGFAEFQWRANLNRIPPGLADLPLWSDAAPAGARIALWNDQGLGDAMLFLRYAARLKARGGVITAVLPSALTRLAGTVPGVDQVCAVDRTLPPFDYQAPLASLPHLLGEADPGTAWTGPYLSSPVVVRHDPSRRSVGLVWAASTDSPNGRERSLSLDVLGPLAALPGIAWTSLQPGAAAEIDASAWQGVLRDVSADLADFAATAAIVAGLDLVISVDTAVAHLAGALGKPVWIMLPRPCDWKWRPDGGGSVWYPTARLLRQDEERNWGRVVADVAEALRLWRPATASSVDVR
jgi:tetratricopeptide (TPR) repeat protein